MHILLPRLAVVALLVFLSGCVTQRFLPDDELVTGDAPIPVTVVPGEISNRFMVPLGDQRAFRARHQQRAARTVTDWSPRPEPLLPEVTLNLETTGKGVRGASWFSLIPYFATFGVFPMIDYVEYENTLALEKNGQELYRHSNKALVRNHAAVWPLIPYFVGSSQDRGTSQMMQASLADHRVRLSSFIAAHEEAYQHQVAGKPADQVHQWLRENPNALFRKRALDQLARKAPDGELEAVQWHRRQMRDFPDYAAHIPERDRIWFLGPDGETIVEVLEQVQQGANLELLAARIRSGGGPYKRFSREEEDRLRSAGMPATVLAAMMEASGPAAATAPPASTTGATAGRHVRDLVLLDNSGQYMSPWTQDGVLAEWVNMTIDARIGEAAGGAVGAVAGAAAGRRVLRNVPGGSFLGGMAGAQAGQATGREMALQAAGGMEHIRNTSDMSFNSLQDMARYLRAMHGSDPNFSDAINAASRIYPGLDDAL